MVSAEDLAIPTNKPSSGHFIEEPGSLFVFFPEGLIAAFIVFAAPFWSISMLLKAQYFQALVLIVGVAGLGYAAYEGFRKNQKWFAYAATVGLIVLSLAVGAWD